MPLVKSQNRLSAAFTKTANIIAVTILMVASVVTFDWKLAGVGAAIEFLYLLSYLFWPSRPGRYPVQEPRAQSEGAGSKISNNGYVKRLTRYLGAAPSRPVVTFLDGVLLVVTIIGFVVIFFFGFGKHLLSHPWPALTHAEGWDAGALIWTGFFLIYYSVKFPFTNEHVVVKAVISLITLAAVPLIYLAAKYMQSPTKHVFFVWLIGISFFVIDLLNWKKHPNLKERNLSKTSLFWADMPMVVAFAVLMVYLWWHRDTEHKDVFVSGVVSCQLLISNAVFVVMEFGLLRSANTATLGGYIRDEGGAIINRAVLTARSLDTNLIQTTISDAEGRFHFWYLPVGRSEISVEAAGFTKQSRSVTLTAADVDDLLFTLTMKED